MILLIKLLVYFISGIQKFINHAIKAGSVAFLIFSFKPNIIQADIERLRLKSLRLTFIVGIQVYVSFHLVIIHHLGYRQVFKRVRIACQSQVIREYLHKHGFTGTGIADKQQVLVNLVVLVWKNLFRKLASIKVIQEESQYFRVVFVHLKLSKLTPHVIISKLPYKVGMGAIFIRVSHIIFKILQNNLSVLFQ